MEKGLKSNLLLKYSKQRTIILDWYSNSSSCKATYSIMNSVND